MGSTTQEKTIFSPGLVSLLPLFYIGWSDSVLSPSEISLIHKKLESYDFLTEEEKAYLIKWTDPKNPPDEHIFRSWVSQIKKYAAPLNPDEKRSLSDMSYNMAVSMVVDEEELVDRPFVKQALREVEFAMGLDNKASLHLLLDRIDHPRPHDYEEPSFPVEEMRIALDGKNILTKDRMRKLLSDPYFKYQTIRNKEEYREHILTLLKAPCQARCGRLCLPGKIWRRGQNR